MTRAMANMIDGLKALGLNKTTTLGIVNFLNTPEKIRAMEDFLISEYDKGNKHPTEQQILRQLKEILRQYGGLNEGVE